MDEKLVVKAIPSSFVAKPLKIREDVGSGEAKLFVGSRKKEDEYNAFFDFDGGYKYVFSKENILEYLDKIQMEYVFQSLNKYKNVSLEMWNSNKANICSMSDDDFKVNLYSHVDDRARYYIRADEEIFRKTIRALALPQVTNVVFCKDKSTKVITINLEINYDFNLCEEPSLENTDVLIGRNILLYGVPGVGKSHKISTEYCSDEEYMERVVFHPDYTYSDFIGQILPVYSEDREKLEYSFVMGPFTKILRKAVNDPEHNYYLVIEEINRGNAPAIFGDVFQLLDRYTEDSSVAVKNPELLGESEYGITNFDMGREVYNDRNHPVKIPSNLFILATMNTADQNVFTLDTAFQRRWELEHIRNDIASAGHVNESVCNSTISWGAFVSVVNEQIADGSSLLGDSGDKRLGAYFAGVSEIRDKKKFSEKVLKYLWDDAFKMDHDKMFASKYNTADSMIEDFEKKDGNTSFETVLNGEVYQKMLDRVGKYAKVASGATKSEETNTNGENTGEME